MQATNRTDGARGVFVGEVPSNRTICREHYRLHLLVDSFPPTRPGQFVQVQCRPLEPPVSSKLTDWPAGRLPQLSQAELRDVEPFLRRPLSLAGRTDRSDGNVELVFIYRVVGTGTRWLSGLAAEDQISVLGPLGNGFTIRGESREQAVNSEFRPSAGSGRAEPVEARIPKSEIGPPSSGGQACPPYAVLVGGGVGIPPLMYLAEALAAAGEKVVAFSGARTADRLPLTLVPQARIGKDATPTPCIAEFAACGASSVVATDDGSLGYRGLISDAFAAWLASSNLAADQVVVYCCGPEAMMQSVAATCTSAGIECQLALERHMACGMGTCQSCIVKTRADGRLNVAAHTAATPPGWKFSLCCTDGPVFDARQVLW